MINWKWVDADELEKQLRLDEAKLLLLKTWNEHPKDLKAMIRLGFFCWYILAESNALNIEQIDVQELEKTLHKVTESGMKEFTEHADFLRILGYMISLFPEFFGELDDYERCKNQGKSMLKKAYELSSDEPVYEYSYLGSFHSDYFRKNAVFRQLQTVLDERFQGEGMMSGYFRSLWREEI